MRIETTGSTVRPRGAARRDSVEKDAVHRGHEGRDVCRGDLY